MVGLSATGAACDAERVPILQAPSDDSLGKPRTAQARPRPPVAMSLIGVASKAVARSRLLALPTSMRALTGPPVPFDSEDELAMSDMVRWSTK